MSLTPTSLVTSLQSGLRGGLLSGLNARAAGYAIATLTHAEVATILGKPAPSLMYRYNEASGATELVGTVASADLADVATPAKQEASSVLGVDTTAMTANSATC